jgi:hypothetical protein
MTAAADRLVSALQELVTVVREEMAFLEQLLQEHQEDRTSSAPERGAEAQLALRREGAFCEAHRALMRLWSFAPVRPTVEEIHEHLCDVRANMADPDRSGPQLPDVPNIKPLALGPARQELDKRHEEMKRWWVKVLTARLTNKARSVEILTGALQQAKRLWEQLHERADDEPPGAG